MSKFFVAVLSCQANKKKVDLIKQTWFKDLPEDYEIRFFTGGHEKEFDDGLNVGLVVDDGYEALPEKAAAIYEYCYKHFDFKWFFKIDDDTIVNFKNVDIIIDDDFDAIVGTVPEIEQRHPKYIDFLDYNLSPDYYVIGYGYFIKRDMLGKIIEVRKSEEFLKIKREENKRHFYVHHDVDLSLMFRVAKAKVKHTFLMTRKIEFSGPFESYIKELPFAVIDCGVYRHPDEWIHNFEFISKRNKLFPCVEISGTFSEQIFKLAYACWLRQYLPELKISNQVDGLYDISLIKEFEFYDPKDNTVINEDDLTKMSVTSLHCVKGEFKTLRFIKELGKEFKDAIRQYESKLDESNQKILNLINESESCFVVIDQNIDQKETLEYFKDAIDKLQTSNPDVDFFVFADDKETADKVFDNTPYIFIKIKDDGQQFSLMKHCKRGISLNSGIGMICKELMAE